MSKIYNEIIIDMNPESDSYMEVLHEDSFDYEGDMMLMQPKEGELVRTYDSHDPQGEWSLEIPYAGEWVWHEGKYYRYSKNSNAYTVLSDAMTEAAKGQGQAFYGEPDELGTDDSADSAEHPTWGAPNITIDMFLKPDGVTPKSIEEVYNELDPILTGITGKPLYNYIKRLFPQVTGVPAEEREFARKAYESDIYDIRGEAGKLSQVGQSIYGGMGAGVRADIAGHQDIARSFERAGTTYEQDIYGLEKERAAGYERQVVSAIGEMPTPFIDPEDVYAKPQISGYSTSWEGDINVRGGGRVPTKEETFLDFLIQLPDAGGS